MLYVYATNSAATADVTATITLEQASGGGPFTSVSAFVDFKPLQILRDGTDVTNGSPTKNVSKCSVDVGEQINLSTANASPLGATLWNIAGTKINSYIANSSIGVVIPFVNNPLDSSISFTWVDGGTETVTVTVASPFVRLRRTRLLTSQSPQSP